MYVSFVQVRDEHRSDYDPGRGGWGAQAQRAEIERRREVEERYMDAETGPGAVAGGGEDWKAAEGAENKLKRGRSPEDENDAENDRSVRTSFCMCAILKTYFGCSGCTSEAR